MMSKPFELIIHRGRNLSDMENSVKGIEEIRSLSNDLRIEIDITVTKDDIPVLFHDISLEKRFAIKGTVFDFCFDELTAHKTASTLTDLKSVLSKFPNQKFLLDLRTDIHEDFFEDSSIRPEDIKLNNFQKLINGLKSVLTVESAKHCRALCGSLNDKLEIEKEFDYLKVDVAERFARTFLDSFMQTGDYAFLGKNPKRVYISISKINQQIVKRYQQSNIDVILCSSMRKYSEIALTKAKQYGVNGLLSAGISKVDINKIISNNNKLGIFPND